MRRLLPAIAVSLLLCQCGKVKDEREKMEEERKKSEEAKKKDVSYVGNWENKCGEDSDLSMLSTIATWLELRENHSMVMELTSFRDKCDQPPSVEMTFDGSYSLGVKSTHPEHQHADKLVAKLSRVTFKPLTPEVAKQFNREEACGQEEWRAGAGKVIAYSDLRKCPLSDLKPVLDLNFAKEGEPEVFTEVTDQGILKVYYDTEFKRMRPFTKRDKKSY